jgi:hypothetical protein
MNGLELLKEDHRKAQELFEQVKTIGNVRQRKQERGRADGEDLNDWLRAEAEMWSALAPERRRSATSRADVGQ